MRSLDSSLLFEFFGGFLSWMRISDVVQEIWDLTLSFLSVRFLSEFSFGWRFFVFVFALYVFFLDLFGYGI